MNLQNRKQSLISMLIRLRSHLNVYGAMLTAEEFKKASDDIFDARQHVDKEKLTEDEYQIANDKYKEVRDFIYSKTLWI